MPGRILTALAVAGALMAVAFVARGVGPREAGKRLELTGTFDDMNGQKIDLAAYSGKPVVINFWATWCGPCRLETPQLVGLWDKFRERGVTILGISVDDQPDAIRAFAAEFKVTYPMLVGLGQDDFVRRAGYDDTLPFSIFIRRDGIVAGEVTGLETTASWEKRIEDLLR
jgi:thiol-disulfide isomerase/thioredoxin